tara:strand:- start:176 stop:328 length:153 start_codon:yes stop_codon:yes gene_type:complete
MALPFHSGLGERLFAFYPGGILWVPPGQKICWSADLYGKVRAKDEYYFNI